MLEICCVTNELIPQKKHILAFQFFFKKETSTACLFQHHLQKNINNNICKKWFWSNTALYTSYFWISRKPDVIFMLFKKCGKWPSEVPSEKQEKWLVLWNFKIHVTSVFSFMFNQNIFMKLCFFTAFFCINRTQGQR